MQYNQLLNQDSINKTIESLNSNGINTIFVQNGDEATTEALKLIKEGGEVMDMTSVTVEQIGLKDKLLSGKYNAVRNKFATMNHETEHLEMQKLGAAPEYVVGSVHAVTEDGHVLIASQTGSQLAAYGSGSSHVIWLVGAQKIVKNVEEGIKRIYDYTLPLESERAQKAYGVAGSAVNKLLIINKEVKPNRIHLILINQVVGF